MLEGEEALDVHGEPQHEEVEGKLLGISLHALAGSPAPAL